MSALWGVAQVLLLVNLMLYSLARPSMLQQREHELAVAQRRLVAAMALLWDEQDRCTATEEELYRVVKELHECYGYSDGDPDAGL